MAIPSRVLGSGISQLSTVSICGDGNAAVTAAGTSAGNATQLTFVYNNVTTTGSGAGVKLPQTEMGETIIIKNGGANPLTVYPYSTASTINSAGYGTINPDCSALFYAVSNTLWEELQGFGRSVPILHYGAFSDTTTQVVTSINSAIAMTFNTTDLANGVTVGSPTSRLVVSSRASTTCSFPRSWTRRQARLALFISGYARTALTSLIPQARSPSKVRQRRRWRHGIS